MLWAPENTFKQEWKIREGQSIRERSHYVNLNAEGGRNNMSHTIYALYLQGITGKESARLGDELVLENEAVTRLS